jgi:TonB family protein
MHDLPSKFARCFAVGRRVIVIGLLVLQTIALPQAVLRAQENDVGSNRKTVQRVAPSYPEIAKTMRLSGKVKIIAKVAPNGKVVATEVVGGHPILARAASDAVLQWRYEPSAQQTSEMAVITFQP